MLQNFGEANNSRSTKDFVVDELIGSRIEIEEGSDSNATKELNLFEDDCWSCLANGLREDPEMCCAKNFTVMTDRHFLDTTQLRSHCFSLFGNLLRKMEDGGGLGLGIDLLAIRPVISYENNFLASPFLSGPQNFNRPSPKPSDPVHYMHFLPSVAGQIPDSVEAS